MKQPTIHITSVSGTDFGIKPVTGLFWNIKGELNCIKVDFMGDQRDEMPMYDYTDTGEFVNIHGNLKGTLIL